MITCTCCGKEPGPSPVVVLEAKERKNLTKESPRVKQVSQVTRNNDNLISVTWNRRVGEVNFAVYCRGCWNFAYQYL